MGTHILVELDLDFEMRNRRGVLQEVVVGQQDSVRRPLRGVVLKKESFATLTVLTNSGQQVVVMNSSAKNEQFANPVNYTSNFILVAASEQRSEKFQTLTTFGATYGFFYGEQPRIMNFQAILLNTADFQWEIEWWANYDEVFRGTQLTDRRARAYLSFDEQVIEGYIISASTSKNSQVPHEVPLNFQMWVTNVTLLQTAGARTYAYDASQGYPEDTTYISEPLLVAGFEADGKKAINGTGGTGLLGKLRAAMVTVDNVADRVTSDIKNFLYGRNLVIPAGFVGSAIYAGAGFTAQYPEISTSTAMRFKVNPGYMATKPTNNFWDNTDEYPARAARSIEHKDIATTNTLPSAGAAIEQTTMAAFKAAGFVVTDNMTGLQQSDAVRALGKAVFAAMSYGASYGVSQAAASVTPGYVTDAAINLAEGGA